MKAWKLGIVTIAIAIAVSFAVAKKNMDDRKYGPGYINCFHGDVATQIDCWTKYLESGVGDAHVRASAFLFRGYGYREEKKFDLAARDALEAVSLEPNNAHNVLFDARALLDVGNCDSAIKAWNHLIYLEPDIAPHYSERSDAYLCRGDREEAMANVNQAIRLNPIGAHYYKQRAELWKLAHDKEKAQADLTMAVSLEGRFDEARCRDERYWPFDCWSYFNAWLPK